MYLRSLAAAVVLLGAAPVMAQQQAIALVLGEHQFTPAEIAVPAGQKVELAVRNAKATPAEFESTSLHREKVVGPGATISVYIGPLDPGRYEFFDDFNPSTRGFVVVK